MSRIAKNPIEIPQKTEVNISGGLVTISGPEGNLSRIFKDDISILVEGRQVSLALKKGKSALWGTYASHIKNMIAGVNKPFSKELILDGIGFKSEVSGGNLVLALGFSHPVKIEIPKNLKVTAEKNIIIVSGLDIEEVGRFAAYVRSQKKPEPYKGKGFRYRNEVIRRKEGKKTV